MIGDNLNVENLDEKDKEAIEEAKIDTTCFGINLLKVARYINLVVGTVMIVFTILYIINFFESFGDLFLHPGRFILNIFMW